MDIRIAQPCHLQEEGNHDTVKNTALYSQKSNANTRSDINYIRFVATYCVETFFFLKFEHSNRLRIEQLTTVGKNLKSIGKKKEKKNETINLLEGCKPEIKGGKKTNL